MSDQVETLQTIILSLLPGISGLSLIIYVFTCPPNPNAEGRLKLPTTAEEDDEDDGEKGDPFDIEDEFKNVDGYPIKQDEFWAKIYVRKLFILASLLIPFVMNLVGLGLYASAKTPLEPPTKDFNLLSSIMLIPFHLYSLTLAFVFLPYTDVSRHWNTTIHLAPVVFVGFFAEALVILLPASETSGSVEGLFKVVRILQQLQPLFLFVPAVALLTLPRGPELYYPADRVFTAKAIESAKELNPVPSIFDPTIPNVIGESSGSIWDYLFFNYASGLIWKGWTGTSLDIWDLPVMNSSMRALRSYKDMSRVYGKTQKSKHKKRSWFSLSPDWALLWKVIVVNKGYFIIQNVLASTTAGLYYAPPFFLKKLVDYIESDPERTDTSWGWVWCFGLLFSNIFMYLAIGVMWQVSSTVLQSRIKLQLNTILFSKTLRKKDLASATGKSLSVTAGETVPKVDVGKATGKTDGLDDDDKVDGQVKEDDEEEVNSKAQVMTLFTVDVDRVADFVFHIFTLVDAPIELIVGSIYLYSVLGVSALIGLATAVVCMPVNHFATKFVLKAQDQLMKARDERTALMNEILGAIRIIKFNAWERKFEQRVKAIREKEISWLRRNYIIEASFAFIWGVTPILVTVIAFLHYVLVLKQPLRPATAFTAVAVFNELRYSLNALPETFMEIVQGLVSLRRISKYMDLAEVDPVIKSDSSVVSINSATIVWPRDKVVGDGSDSIAPSIAATPKAAFTLSDVNLEFPEGKLSLICGRLGSGKSLLLMGLLGEADCVAGFINCPRSSPDTMDHLHYNVSEGEWVLPGVVAYAPQSAYLQNASIKDNILFGSPWKESRYRQVLNVCSLEGDLDILEDGDETEIGEKGLNLSGGQKARVSLARAVYSRASILLLDDVLSAVDAHTSSFLVEKCFQGELMAGRTTILVSHHTKLVGPIASFIAALDNGDVVYSGDLSGFIAGGHMEELEKEENDGHEPPADAPDHSEDPTIEVVNKQLAKLSEKEKEPDSETSTLAGTDDDVEETKPQLKRKTPRKLVEDEKRATGRIAWPVWMTYFRSQGGFLYWTLFIVSVILAGLSPVLENTWLKIWSGSYTNPNNQYTPAFFVSLYAAFTLVGLALITLRFYVVYMGSINVSRRLHERLLESCLRATLRFHDTAIKGRTLNRFGKDLENADSQLADHFGRTVFYLLNIIVTLASITYVGGWAFALVVVLLLGVYVVAAAVYGATSRDVRRLDSTTKSPLYAIYSELLAGATVVRAYGASTLQLRTMLRIAESNVLTFVWNWSLTRWISTRINVLSSVAIGCTGVVVLVLPVSAPAAGFALAFAGTVANDLLFVVRRWVGLEMSMVAVERLKEYSELPPEGPEFIEPRPPASWPHSGSIEVKNLVIKYAPELPDVLHNLTFNVKSAEKVGIVGATGSGKSTFALSIFRFVEPTAGSISIDGIDISSLGLTDLRSRLTIIPQDPTILSGTLRSTLDIFDEYEDSELYEALRRVHLLKADEETAEGSGTAVGEAEEDERNKNVFKNLESPVSEGGDNFSSGEKQLICMARAILKRNKVLVLDESTASVDYKTDELISKTIREEFADSTLLTIAHRLSTIVDYDKVLVMDKGSIAEYDSPSNLLRNKDSKFYGLCKATGRSEFRKLKKAADEAEAKRLHRS